MFDIGFWELVIIGIVALLFVGPDQLPSFTSKIGYWLGNIRRIIINARREISQELNLNEHIDLKNKISDLDELMENAPDQDPKFTNNKDITPD